MRRTISIAKGKGSIGHNSRDFKAENIDPDRVHLNTCYVNEELQETYHKLFDTALENYNAKQKRNDRKIPDYYEKIRTSKQEKLFYEIIVQVGNFKEPLPVLDYKREKRAEEVAQLDEELHKLMVNSENLILKNDALIEEVNERQDEINFLTHRTEECKKEIDDLTAKLDKVEDKITKKYESTKVINAQIKSMAKDKDKIITTVADLVDNPKWQLQEPQILMTAATYKVKKALPLVTKLKEYITAILVEHFNLKQTYKRLLNSFNNIKTQLEREKSEVKYLNNVIVEYDEDLQRLAIVEKALGSGEINKIIRNYKRKEQDDKATVVPAQNKPKKSKGYER